MRLSEIHAETLPPQDYPQVRVVNGDALDVDIDDILKSAGESSDVSVVANIPYNITSPLVARLLEECSASFRVIVMLVQKEVAVRLASGPGSSEYGAFSVFAQFYADVDIVSVVPPTVFFPRPKVTSAIVRLRPWSEPLFPGIDRELFFKIVRASFQQRRKTILNALSSDATGWNKEDALSVLNRAEIDPTRRGETLSLAEFARIANAR